MKNKRIELLQALLLSTSQLNKLRYTKEKKQRWRAIGSITGLMVVFLLVIAFGIMMCMGCGELGIAGTIPTICGLMISLVAFTFTLIKTNGYLFHFKEYDMLMALPFEPKTIAADKFLFMYINTMPWILSVSIAMVIGYGIYEKPSLPAYPVWILLSFVLPLIPMLGAAFLGFVIARISARFEMSNMVQTILLVGVIVAGLFGRVFIEGIAGKQQIMTLILNMSRMFANLGEGYPPLKWFRRAVSELSIVDMLLLIGVSAFLFEMVFYIVGRSYRQINSAFASHTAKKAYHLKSMRSSSILHAIAFKEMRRMTGSSVYMANVIIGDLLALLLGIAVPFIGLDRVIALVTQGAPITAKIIYPAIPMIVYFLVGMVATTAMTPSLEGKNYWIVQSLPISKKTLYQGKMLFNLYLTLPVAVFATTCLCISAKIPALTTCLYLVQVVALCLFSTVWGCVCGIKFMKLDWENEIEVVKQGAATAVYLFPNMLISIGLIVLTVYLGFHFNINLIAGIVTGIAAILALVSYRIVLHLAL